MVFLDLSVGLWLRKLLNIQLTDTTISNGVNTVIGTGPGTAIKVTWVSSVIVIVETSVT